MRSLVHASAPVTNRVRRWGAVIGVLSLVVLLSPLDSAKPAAAAVGSKARTAVTKSRTVDRTYLDHGHTTTLDKRKVTLQVDQTQGLRSLQLIHVSWSGAHPTGGLVPDQNSNFAQNEEYPMALFECRGTDTAAHPISPDTCWTQYADERFTNGSDDQPYPAWRSDAHAGPAERAAFVNRPRKETTDCQNSLSGSTYERWVPFVGADKTVYGGGPFGCQGLPPEASPANLTGNVALPSNETYGVTDPDGHGSADFDVFTGEDHASLGCSATVACTLVAVPVEGISCDPAGAELPARQRPDAAGVEAARENCEQTGHFQPGQYLSLSQSGEQAVDGSLWWAPSNWRNRISVPLSFAPADNVCSLQGSAAPEDVYGSELMIQATTSWAPYFCLNPKLFALNHVQTPEPQARSLLQQGNIDAAYTSEPSDVGYPEPTVNAPVALTGFGIAYDVDGDDHAPLPKLNLDARLIAKLLTESYPDQTYVQNADQALSHNPLNITQDPEFQALNPGVPQRFLDSASTLLTVNTDSDVMTALTSYLNADPEARAWLNGKPDPWGMTVNPNYRKIALPVDNWPLLDTFEPLDEYQPGRIDCLYANPVPFLPLVAAPTARLSTISQDMQFAISQSQTVCVLPSPTPGSLAGAKMVAVGRQGAGTRAMFGVVSLGDAKRDGLAVASLESTSSVSPTTKITGTGGRTFVDADNSSLRAAAKALVPDASTGTWTVPYAKLRKHDTAAYPGTMPVYAAIPTQGLAKTDAADFGKFLAFAAGRGQHPGTGQGDLPAGYLPMTSANGLGALADYTARAAAAVSAQRGSLPALIDHAQAPAGAGTAPAGSGHGGGPRAGSHNPGGASNGSNPAGGTRGAVTGVSPTAGSTTPAAKKSPAPASSSATSPTSIAASPVANATPRLGSGLSGLALPILFGIAILAGVAALVTRLNSGKRGAP